MKDRLTLTVNPTFTAVPIRFGAGLCLGDWADVNGDGWLDVLGTWNPAQPTFAVLLNTRDGTFVRGWQERLSGELTLGFRTDADYENDADAPKVEVLRVEWPSGARRKTRSDTSVLRASCALGKARAR